MASTYSDILRIQKQANGENTNTWGTITNTNFELFEDAIAGVVSVSLNGATGYTLSNNNGTADEARNMAVVLKGAPTSNVGVNFGAYSKPYVIRNKITTGSSVRLQVAGDVGTELKIPNTFIGVVWSDGTNIREISRAVNEQRLVPAGDGSGFFISMWSGEIANIPTGWQLCDGTNGTPDLRDRFIVGYSDAAGASIGVSLASGAGNSGGLRDRALVVDTSANGAHTHTVAATSITLVCANLPPTHVRLIYNGSGDSALALTASNYLNDSGAIGGDNYKYNLAGTGNAADVGRSGSLEGAASDPIAINVSAATVAAHTHAVSIQTSVLPPYYTLAFIAYTG